MVLVVSLGAMLPAASALHVGPGTGTSSSSPGENVAAVDDDAYVTEAAIAGQATGIVVRDIPSSRDRTEESSRKSLDYDGDGITNREESRLGTNMMMEDSDGDGLSDRAELMQYGTSPTNSDTNGDGVPDGNEFSAPPLQSRTQTYTGGEPVDSATDEGHADLSTDEGYADVRSLHVERQPVTGSAASPEPIRRPSSVTAPDAPREPSTAPEQVASPTTRAEMTPLQIVGLTLLGLFGLGAVAATRIDRDRPGAIRDVLPTTTLGIATPTGPGDAGTERADRESGDQERTTQDGSPPGPVTAAPTDDSTGDGTGIDVPDRIDLTDDRRVEMLLESAGGRLKQSTIVESTEWSKAKVSRLLTSMESDDRIRKVRVGRENLICMPGHEPDAVSIDGPG